MNRREKMELLFDRTAEVFLAILDQPIEEISPGTLQCIVKFLETNEITAIPTDDTALGELTEALPNEIWKQIQKSLPPS